MKITHNDQEMFFKWWVTWKADAYLSEMAKEHGNGHSEMADYLRVNRLNCLIASNVGGRSGYGFKEEIEAIRFYLTFSHLKPFQE